MILIREFADNKRDLQRDLRGKTEQIIEHIFKMFLMPNHESYNHWKQEIASFLSEVTKLKNTKKFPISKQLYDWTYNIRQDLITDKSYVRGKIKNIAIQYDMDEKKLMKLNAHINYICKKLNFICESYFKWLCSELSKYGIVTYDKIYDKLDELLKGGNLYDNKI